MSRYIYIYVRICRNQVNNCPNIASESTTRHWRHPAQESSVFFKTLSMYMSLVKSKTRWTKNINDISTSYRHKRHKHDQRLPTSPCGKMHSCVQPSYDEHVSRLGSHGAHWTSPRDKSQNGYKGPAALPAQEIWEQGVWLRHYIMFWHFIVLAWTKLCDAS